MKAFDKEPVYTPRNDFVLLRIVNKGEVRGIAMPDRAEQGKETRVVACGPKVVDLFPGMRVLAIGTPGQDIVPLPNHPDLIVTKEANIILTVDEA